MHKTYFLSFPRVPRDLEQVVTKAISESMDMLVMMLFLLVLSIVIFSRWVLQTTFPGRTDSTTVGPRLHMLIPAVRCTRRRLSE